jgi:poly-gamma-glutamate synthesis protein (capsule biosynthesis protein)
LVNLFLDEKGIDFRMIPYIQCNDNPIVIPMDNTQCEFFYNQINELNSILSSDERLDNELSHYMEQTSADYLLALEPYSSRAGEGLYRRGLLPSFVNEKRLLKLYDFVLCESHQERLVHLLKEKYKNLRK